MLAFPSFFLSSIQELKHIELEGAAEERRLLNGLGTQSPTELDYQVLIKQSWREEGEEDGGQEEDPRLLALRCAAQGEEGEEGGGLPASGRRHSSLPFGGAQERKGSGEATIGPTRLRTPFGGREHQLAPRRAVEAPPTRRRRRRRRRREHQISLSFSPLDFLLTLVEYKAAFLFQEEEEEKLQAPYLLVATFAYFFVGCEFK